MLLFLQKVLDAEWGVRAVGDGPACRVQLGYGIASLVDQDVGAKVSEGSRGDVKKREVAEGFKVHSGYLWLRCWKLREHSRELLSISVLFLHS